MQKEAADEASKKRQQRVLVTTPLELLGFRSLSRYFTGSSAQKLEQRNVSSSRSRASTKARADLPLSLHAVCHSDYYFIVSGGSNESL